MTKEQYEKLKKDLQEAVKSNNRQKIEEIKSILNLNDKYDQYFKQGLTGYPSIDKVWLKYYKEDAEDLANNIPVNKTVWDTIEEKLLEYFSF